MKGRAVAVVEGSTSERFARSYGARLQLLPTLEDAIGLLRDGGSDAVVADRPILSYWLSQNPHSSLQLSEASYQPQGYGFALSPEAFVLRARFDQAVLKLVADGRIAELSKEWIGAN
jgi:polar amino acid transport system substrate-binding protein